MKMTDSFQHLKTLTQSLVAVGLTFSSICLAQNKTANQSREISNKTPIAVIFANDGQPMQASIDFYRAVYKSLATSSIWEAYPIELTRKGLGSKESAHLGGIPTIDRDQFRSQLPKKSKRGKIRPGAPVAELQRFLDNTRTNAVIVADCARKDRSLLKACALYYYDRVLSRVAASSIKSFVSGANDASGWASPLLKSLEVGISAAQREKDQAVIEELVARNELDDQESERYGMIGLYGKGDRTGLSNGDSLWRQTISGGGLQLGFLSSNVGAYLDLAQLTWSGSSDGLAKTSRTNYGLGMMFRANALDSLLWFFEISGGKEKNVFQGSDGDNSLDIEGVYIQISPGIGLELSDIVTLNLGIGWRWFFENSKSSSGSLKDASLQDTHGPSLMLRGILLI